MAFQIQLHRCMFSPSSSATSIGLKGFRKQPNFSNAVFGTLTLIKFKFLLLCDCNVLMINCRLLCCYEKAKDEKKSNLI